jgi:transposase-like protein
MKPKISADREQKMLVIEKCPSCNKTPDYEVNGEIIVFQKAYCPECISVITGREKVSA